MNTAGLSRSRLERMHRVLSGYVERQEMPGLVALVSHHDDVHVETLGTLAFAHPAPMKRDTIFHIASITKPITAVAAMILVEECKLRLDESIEGWLPELANRRVLKSISSDLDDTVPALRAITVRDLLTYCIGFGSVMAMPDTYPIQKLIREYRIGGDGPMLPSQAPGMDEWLQRLGSLPFNSPLSNVQGLKSFSGRIPVGASAWRWTLDAGTSSTLQAASVGPAASAPQPTPIRRRE